AHGHDDDSDARQRHSSSSSSRRTGERMMKMLVARGDSSGDVTPARVMRSPGQTIPWLSRSRAGKRHQPQLEAAEHFAGRVDQQYLPGGVAHRATILRTGDAGRRDG
ncbi:hypothetical protein ACWEU6_08335, partial [Streptosporangium sandarakinum]|uniref:hypothetical protein n=1 Tax=Streptosporangium sandarakinum TaxID=1260955 RepID=UPI0036C85205